MDRNKKSTQAPNYLSMLMNNDPRVRMYLEQFTFGGKPKDITQKNFKDYFSKEEINLLNKIVRTKGGDKGTITYKDYFYSLPNDIFNRKRTPTDKEMKTYQDLYKKTNILRNTLGGFEYTRDKKTGKYKIKDKYDWGKEYTERGHASDPQQTAGVYDPSLVKGRNVTGLEALKNILSGDFKEGLEMVANAYGPREEQTKENRTLVDLLNIRPKARQISYSLPYQHKPTT